jgi:hypothetical protein
MYVGMYACDKFSVTVTVTDVFKDGPLRRVSHAYVCPLSSPPQQINEMGENICVCACMYVYVHVCMF